MTIRLLRIGTVIRFITIIVTVIIVTVIIAVVIIVTVIIAVVITTVVVDIIVRFKWSIRIIGMMTRTEELKVTIWFNIDLY